MCDLSNSPNIILGSADIIQIFNTETNAVITLPNSGHTPTSILYDVGVNKIFFTVASFQGIYAYDIATGTSTPYTEGFDEDVSFISADNGQCILCRGQHKFYLFETGTLSVIYTSDSFLTGPGYIYGDCKNILITDTGAGTITQYLNYMMPKYITTIKNVTSPTFGTFKYDKVYIVTSTTIDVITFDNVQPIEISSNVTCQNVTCQNVTCQNVINPTIYYGSADSTVGNQQSYVDGYTRFVIYWAVVLVSPGTAGDTVTLIDLPVDFLKTNSVQVSHNILTYPEGDDGSIIQPFAPVARTSTSVEANLGITGTVAGTYTGRSVFVFYPENQ